MSASGNDYLAALRAARNRGHALSRSAVGNVVAALRDALRDLPTGGDKAIDRAAARAMRQQILGIIRELENATVDGTRRAVRVTVNDIVNMHARVNAKILARHDISAARLIDRYKQVNVRALAAIASRTRNAATFRTLVHRHMSDAAPDLDRLLQRAVARGVSARNVARDVEDLLRGDHPSLRAYDMRINELSGLRTVSYDARRIALSEVNNAAREANAIALQASPIVAAMKWQLSGNHGDPDECDDLANADEYGFGPGYYPPDKWPEAPHPQCGCYAGDVLFHDVSEWAARAGERAAA